MFGCFSKLGAFLWYRATSSGISRQCFYLVSLECEVGAGAGNRTLVLWVEARYNSRYTTHALFGAMYGNQTHLMRVCNPPPKSVSQHGHIVWCPQRDSNSHAQRPRFLKPLCLPFHHRGIIWWTYTDSNRKLRAANTACSH